jgi:hypothetical protein
LSVDCDLLADVMQALSAYSLPTREFLTIPGLGNPHSLPPLQPQPASVEAHSCAVAIAVPGTNLNAYFLYPPGFSKTAGIKYPVLINVYGGPGNQQVTSVFGVGARGPGFHTYLAVSQSISQLSINLSCRRFRIASRSPC